MSSRSFLLLIGAGGDGGAAYREFVLSRIAATEHPVVLVDTAAPAWTIPYLASDHPHIRAGLSDPAAVASAVKAFAADHNIAGVMTYMGHHVVTAAEIAQMLGLPSSPAEAMAVARGKATTRRLLDQYKVPSAKAMEAPTLEAALAHADSIGYPVMVKPRSQAGSAGVVRADNHTQIREACGVSPVDAWARWWVRPTEGSYEAPPASASTTSSSSPRRRRATSPNTAGE